MNYWLTPAAKVCHKCHQVVKQKVMGNLGDDMFQPLDWVCCKKCDPMADEEKVLFTIPITVNGVTII